MKSLIVYIAISIIIFLNCGCTNTNAPVVGGGSPVVAFSKNYLWGDETGVTDFIECDNGNFYVIGWERLGNIQNAFLMKVDPVGNQIWRKVYGGGGTRRFINIQRIHDGGYVVTGDASINNHLSVWLLKFDLKGNMLWQKFYEDNSISFTSKVIELNNGCFFIEGGTNSFIQDDIFIIKTDIVGNKIWIKKYGRPGIFDCLHKMIPTDDGGIMCAGHAQMTSSENEDAWLFKIDLDGNILWNKYFGGPYYDGTFTLTHCSDGNFMTAGWTCDSDYSNPKIWMMKMNTNGDTLYSRKITTTVHYRLDDIKQIHDGNFVLVGEFRTKGSSFMNAVILKIDMNGNILWQLRIPENFDNYFSHLTELSSGRIIASGSKYPNNKRNGWLVGIDFNKCVQPVKTK